MQYVRLTKTDGAKQQPIFMRRDGVLWVQGAAPTAVPVPEEAEASGSGAILHLDGGAERTVTVVESVDEVIRTLEAEDGADAKLGQVLRERP